MRPRPWSTALSLLRLVLIAAAILVGLDFVYHFAWMPVMVRQVFVPLAGGVFFALALFLAYDAIRFFRRTKDQVQWQYTGRCPFCGYDRRGLSKWSPCPECGEPKGGGLGRD